MADLGQLTVRIDSDTSRLESGLNRTKKAVKVAGKAVAVAGLAISAAIVGIGAKSIQTAAEFEKGMSKVQAITNSTDDQMKLLEESAKNLGATTAFSAKEAAEGMSFLGMAGFETNEIISAMPGLLDLAAASGEELGRTADIVSDAMSAFKLEAEDTGKFADVLATAASKANVSVSTLGESFKYAAPVAGALSFSVEDVTAALGAMGNKGIKASQAGTSLRTAMTNMSVAAGNSGSVFAELGIELANQDGSMRELNVIIDDLTTKFSTMTEAQKASSAEALFGKNAMSGMLAILDDNTGAYESLREELLKSDGAAKKMANTMLDNLSGAMTLLNSATEGLMIQIGEHLTPVLKDAVNFISSSVIPFVGKMAESFFDFAKRSAPVVESAIENITAVSNEMWNFFNANLLPILEDLKATAIEVFEAIKPVAIDMFEVIVEKATIWWNFFTENILPVIEKLHSTAIKLFPIVQDIAVTAFEGIKTTAMILWGVFENNLLPIIKAVFNFVNDNWGVFETIIVTAFTVIKIALDVAITVFTTFWDSLRQGFDYVQTVFSTISDIIGLAFDNVVTSVQNVIDVFTRVKDTIQKAIDALKEFFKQEKKGDSDSSGGRGEKGGSNTVRGQRAFGGAVKAGESYLINEGSGGEIFTPSTNGTVSPGMGNVTINVNGAGDPYVIANQIVTILNTQGVKSR